jgi:tetratricopeptide (TPR) repeat protein
MYAVHARRLQKSAEPNKNNKKPDEYFREVKAHLREGKQKEAFMLLQEAVLIYPNESTLMSYYGYLLAIVDRKYRMGIATCLKAIENLRTLEKNCDVSRAYPVFYYNLGKAYSAAGKRKESVDALNNGLSFDPSNGDIKKELQRMGVRRKKPPIPFLDRSNPLNKYLGIALYRRKK